MEKSNAIKLLVLLIGTAFGISVGLLFLILGCVLGQLQGEPNSWWSLMAIFLFFFTPVPDLFARLITGYKQDSEHIGIYLEEHVGAFTTAVLGTCGVGLLVIFAIIGVIPWITFGFELGGAIIILVSIFTAMYISRIDFSKCPCSNDDDDFKL